MRKGAFLFVSIAGLVMSGVAAMADPAPGGASTGATDTDPNAIECRTGMPTTGTRLGAHRECHTHKQWEDMQQQAAKALSDMQNGTRLTDGK